MPVPEQRHFLLKRTIRRQHAIGPPIGNAIGLQPACPQPVEEFVGHRLQAAVAGRLDLDAHRFAGFLGEVGGGGARGGEGFQSRIMGAGVIERRKLVRNVLVIHQRLYCRFGRHGREPGDFLRGPTEAGALQQMRRAFRIPVLRVDRRQVAGPVGRRNTGDRGKKQGKQGEPAGRMAYGHHCVLLEFRYYAVAPFSVTRIKPVQRKSRKYVS